MVDFRPKPKPVKTKKRRRSSLNLSEWRQGVLALYGPRCRSCGHRGPADGSHLAAHHLIFKSHCADQYVTDPRNGIPLCNFMGNDCHDRLHQSKLKIEKRWLPKVVLECLDEQGLSWNEDGEPVGTLAKYFAREVRHDGGRSEPGRRSPEDPGLGQPDPAWHGGGVEGVDPGDHVLH